MASDGGYRYTTRFSTTPLESGDGGIGEVEPVADCCGRLGGADGCFTGKGEELWPDFWAGQGGKGTYPDGAASSMSCL